LTIALGAQLHRQDDHLHAAQMEAPLEGHRRLVVEQSGQPVLPVENELARKEHSVGEFH